jgi:flagellar L-ring protein precursor FlgH
MARVLLTGLGVLLWVAAADGQSLWRDGSLYADFRARAIDDIVTILIVEESASSRAVSTKSEKDTTRTAAVGKFPTFLDPVAKKLVKPVTRPLVGYQDPSTYLQDSLTLDLGTKGKHEGKGGIDRTERLTGQIAARVVKVLDNGNLVIEGRRAVVLNDETQVVTISGVVRPQDVTAQNTVLSSQIADAEVQMEGSGVLAEAQRPGILYRILDWLGLF